ncbi:MAG: hypothetical protein D6730_13850, partial [Bacteroidetes bacterium]
MHIPCQRPFALLVLVAILSTLNLSSGFAQCNCDHLISQEVVYINGADNYSFQPGDTVCLQAGIKPELWIINVKGTAEAPITFINCGGQLVLQQPNQHSYVLKISDSEHIRFTGTGDPAFEYGVRIIGEGLPGSGSGVELTDIYNAIELDHLEVSNTEFAGIWAKELPFNCDLHRGNFTLNDLKIHHNKFYDIGTEAVYITRENAPYTSASMSCGDSLTIYPYGMKGTRIFNNHIERTGWDAMEVHGAFEDCEIYGNTIIDYGLAGDPGQQKGILMGDGTTGKCYNNVLKNGAGDGIVLNGWKTNTVFNNIIENTGRIGILCRQRSVPTDTGAYEILNNTIVNTGFDGVMINSSITRNFVLNNIIVNPSNLEFITLGPGVNATTAGNYLDMDINNVQFVDPENSDYNLLPFSPLINQGVDVSPYGLSFDLNNQSSPAGPAYDIGAYEFQDVPLPPLPPQVLGPPAFNAQSPNSVQPYDGLFRYGSNVGFYPGWTDEQLADIAAGNPDVGQLGLGAKSFRPSLPEHLVEQFGYKVRLHTFEHYQQLGMDDHTLFIGFPADSNGHRDPNSYCDDGAQSWLFDNMYESIWDNGQGGTPVNENNYFAHYVYKIVYLYKDYVKFWQVVNEPDFDGGGAGWFPPASEDSSFADVNWWDNDPDPCVLGNMKAPVEHYIRMLRITYEIVKALAPDDYVVLGGIAYGSFLDAILRNTDNPGPFNPEGIGAAGSVDPQLYPYTGGAYFDVVTFHLYPQFSSTVRYFTTTEFVYHRHSDAAVAAIDTMKAELEQVLLSRGYDDITYPKKHFSITEINIPRKAFPYEDPGSAGENYIGGDEVQRNFVIKAFVQAQISGLLQLYLYNLADDATFEEATTGFELMGTYKPLGTPYQAEINSSGIAFRTVATELFGYRYSPLQTAAMQLPQGVKGAAFQGGDGSFKYVLWAETQFDESEFAQAVYAFPPSFGYNTYGLRYKAWDYGFNPWTGLMQADSVLLGGAPIFLEPHDGSFFPIELLKFEASPQGSQVALRWSTAWERDNDYFTVERSPDGQHFSALFDLSSQGDSQTPQYYEAVDPAPLQGSSYYRLKQTDLNGAFTYSS